MLIQDVPRVVREKPDDFVRSRVRSHCPLQTDRGTPSRAVFRRTAARADKGVHAESGRARTPAVPGKMAFFFKLVLGGRRGFPTCGPERSAAAPGGHAGRGKESAAKAAVRRMACRSVCISFNTGYIIEDDVSGRASQNNIKEDDVSCSLSVICPEPTRMCHKVTHKNLIDSSPLFRNSQIKI